MFAAGATRYAYALIGGIAGDWRARSYCRRQPATRIGKGGALDLETGILYVPSRTAVDVLALIQNPKGVGKQYIAMFVGDGKTPGELVTLAIPDEKKPARPQRAEE